MKEKITIFLIGILIIGCYQGEKKEPALKNPCIIYSKYGYSIHNKLCYYKGWEIIMKHTRNGLSTKWILVLRNPETKEHHNHNVDDKWYEYYSVGDTI